MPQTSRCLSIYQDEDEDMVVVAQELSDFMVLQQEHIDLPEECELFAFVSHGLKQPADGISPHGQADLLRSVSQYLLETFRPPSLTVNMFNTGSGKPDSTFHILLNNGIVYACSLNKNGNNLRTDRCVMCFHS